MGPVVALSLRALYGGIGAKDPAINFARNMERHQTCKGRGWWSHNYSLRMTLFYLVTRRLWKFKGPERASMCPWLARQERLPTMKLLKERNSSIDVCPIFANEEGTVLYVHRDCKRAREIWDIFVNPRHARTCYSFTEFSPWIDASLQWNSAKRVDLSTEGDYFCFVELYEQNSLPCFV